MTEQFSPPVTAAPTHRNDTLKIIALVTMFIDHVGAMFFPDQMLWRTIGRIAFPIFSWQLVEGYVHTSDRARYGLRIFLFGCVAQAPYMFLNAEFVMRPYHINIMFQLFTGVVLLGVADRVRHALGKAKDHPAHGIILSFLWLSAATLLIILPDILAVCIPEFQFSYGTYGQLLFLMFYLFRGRPVQLFFGYVALSVFHAVEMCAVWESGEAGGTLAAFKGFVSFWTTPSAIAGAFLWSLKELPAMSSVFFQARSIVTLPVIWIFENRPGKLRLNRWIAYWFYPLHISLLVGVKWLMLNGYL